MSAAAASGRCDAGAEDHARTGARGYEFSNLYFLLVLINSLQGLITFSTSIIPTSRYVLVLLTISVKNGIGSEHPLL
jgi:hypothetical protein